MLSKRRNEIVSMRKHEIANKILDKIDLDITRPEAELFIDTFFDILAYELANGEHYSQKNFASFKRVEKAARKGRNPQTGEPVDIPATRGLKVIPSPYLKDLLAHD